MSLFTLGDPRVRRADPVGGLLEGLLPEAVTVVELFADPPHVALFPQEAEIAALAGAKRRREFTTVRWCAHTALTRLGVVPGPIVPDPDAPEFARHAPRWPDGVVGSMTHCDGYRAAAVARGAEVASVGVDAEQNAPVPEAVRELVLLPEERLTHERLTASHPGVAWDRLLFSAKESVYKAWFPLTGRWLDFDECAITPDPDLGTFTGNFLVPGPVVGGKRLGRFTGRWRTLDAAGGGRLATAVVVARPPARGVPAA